MMRLRFRLLAKWSFAPAILLVLAGAVALSQGWLPAAKRLIACYTGSAVPQAEEDCAGCGEAACGHGSQEHVGDKSGACDHAGGDRAGDGHAGEDQCGSLQLSPQAEKNIGLSLATVELRPFDRTISVPATVVARPGRTEMEVSAPMNGVVARIYPVQGEAVTPGQPLFDLRLTHEDLVQVQGEFLRTVEELAVVKREVARLEQATASGAIAGKTLMERQYEQQKTEAILRAQQEALILHGLTPQQVEEIISTRKLLQELTVVTPQPARQGGEQSAAVLLQVAELTVRPGQHVLAGTRLCVLDDQAELYIEGKAFAEDAEDLQEAACRGWPMVAVFGANGKGKRELRDLKILYVENQIELESRALRFYVRLPNEAVRNDLTPDGRRFVGWRYKPRQRAELLLPVERWEGRIILPLEAVVKEGADWFVFQKQGDCFHRRPVHVEYHDQRWAVLGGGGPLAAGDVVAASGAYQIHLAMKNKAGGGADPHAGHNH
jgi:multidrug efflux pump subunit AcrA (membrane-fusion protein)